MANSLLNRVRALFGGEQESAAAEAAQALPRLKRINERKANQSPEDSSEAMPPDVRRNNDTATNHDNHGVAHWTFNSDKMIRQTVRRSDQLSGVAVGFEVDPH